MCRLIVVLIVASFGHWGADGSLDIGLNDGWQIANANRSIVLHGERLPSGVYSALERANRTGSVLAGFNDVQLRWVSLQNWTYELRFDVDAYRDHIEAAADDAATQCVLTFHGIDTLATIWLNGVELRPAPRNMFVRYRYDVCGVLEKLNNTLTVRILAAAPAAAALAAAAAAATPNGTRPTPPECPPARYNGECHANQLRKMQASFSWDWGPAVPSSGLWRPVQLELYRGARIRDVTYALHWRPASGEWLIDVGVHLESGAGAGVAGAAVRGVLRLEMPTVLAKPERWSVANVTIDAATGEFSVLRQLRVPASRVALWWTNGLGAQPLYELHVRWEGDTYSLRTNRIHRLPVAAVRDERTVRIGFRTVELIEERVEPLCTAQPPAAACPKAGTTFYVRLNGVPVFMKGSNWIPAHILPEIADTAALRRDRLLLAASEVHMNMLRVWGGGFYEADGFYERASELGVLIWQDAMFACAMYPVGEEFLASVALEMRQNGRRLQRHAALALWAGNNENEAALVQNWYGTAKEYGRFAGEYERLYGGVVGPALRAADGTRPWLFSSPSNGPLRAQEQLIQGDPQDARFGDVHYYNYVLDGWDPNIYPHPRFASEYGFQSYPRYSAWRSTASPSATNLTALLDHRQHFPLGDMPILLLCGRHLPAIPAADPANPRPHIEALAYFTQLSQAQSTRTETEVYRTGRGTPARTMGALYWQLNDVWVAPSWSSLEYGTANWKVLHHWAADFLAPVAVAALRRPNGRTVDVHVVRDTLGAAAEYAMRVERFRWSQLGALEREVFDGIRVLENAAQLALSVELPAEVQQGKGFVRVQLLNATSGAVVAESLVLGASPKRAVGLRRDCGLTWSVLGEPTCNAARTESAVEVRIRVTAPALWVWLTVVRPDVLEYRWSANGFVLADSDGERVVSVRWPDAGCKVRLRDADLRVQTVNEYVEE